MQGSGDGELPPEEAAPLLLHNTALLRNKRLLMAYTCATGPPDSASPHGAHAQPSATPPATCQ